MDRKTITACLAVGLFLVSACGDSVKPEPVAECKEYEATLLQCFHRKTGFASQASLIPKTRADRERIRQMCAENLARMKPACP
jgi:hypothetical protein